jgi:hypothetical protein
MTRDDLFVWMPRLLGIAAGAFLSLFAWDAFRPGLAPTAARVEFAMNLIPSAVVLVVVALSWRRPWIGGVAFVALGAAYALWVRSRPDWILAISGPLFALAIVFFWSWRRATGHVRSARTT